MQKHGFHHSIVIRHVIILCSPSFPSLVSSSVPCPSVLLASSPLNYPVSVSLFLVIHYFSCHPPLRCPPSLHNPLSAFVTHKHTHNFESTFCIWQKAYDNCPNSAVFHLTYWFLVAIHFLHGCIKLHCIAYICLNLRFLALVQKDEGDDFCS